MSELKYAWRQLRKSPGFTAVAVLTLAIGIGASTAIFSLVNSVLIEPLPYRHSERLTKVMETLADGSFNAVSGGAFKDWRENNSQFERLAISEGVNMNVTGNGVPERVSGLRVSSEFLPVFGVTPKIGRDFAKGEDAAGGNNHVLLLSQGLWRGRFGGDSGVVGKSVSLDQASYTVIGVLPANALMEDDAKFLIPEVIDGPGTDWSRSGHFREVTGRLRPGASVAQGEADLRDIKRRLNSEYPLFKKDWSVTVRPLKEVYVGEARPSLLLLLGTVGMVLLIACANVSNLLLARGVARSKEMAVRAALGARSWQIVRQALTESLLLAGAGGAAGLLLAVFGVRFLTGMVAGMIPHPLDPEINVKVLCFSALLAGGCGLLFGILPALRAGRVDANSALKEAGRGSTGASQRRSHSLLVAAEYAFTLVLLIGAGLFLRSFAQLINADPGFNPRRTLAFDLSFPNASYPKAADRLRFIHALKERVEKIPGIESVAASSSLPLGEANETEYASRGDQPPRTDYIAGCNFVSADYFSAMGMILQRGRGIEARDDNAMAPRVVVVDETLVSHLYPGEDPIGKSLTLLGQSWEIVGITRSVRHFAIDRTPQAIVYGAFSHSDGYASIVIRTGISPLSLKETVMREVLKLDPDQPIGNVRTLDYAVRQSLSSKRAITTLLGMFAAVAIGLACVGIYGVTAHAVGQRTRELSIRRALGARPSGIIQLVLKGAMKPSLAGIAAGLAGAAALVRLIQSQLFEVKAFDPEVFLLSTGLLVLVAAFSIYVPARRAAAADPMKALREE